MRAAIRIVKVFVGVLFIISGLVKANDPLGLSYKMQEFFELWGAGLSQGNFIRNTLDYFHQNSLALSIIMITLEIVAGIALLIGWKKRFVLWMLLLLIVFFTFLTGYAYLSGKFTNCGCFGDCLPITPLTSFIKDIVLLIMIVFLLAGQKYITPIFTSGLRTALLLAGLIFSVALQWYVLNYLPLADCLPFKKGNNIAEQMKPPPGSRPDSVVMKFIYEKDGKQYEWAMNELPADIKAYKYVDRVDKIVRKGNAEPPIKGFSLTGVMQQDSTQIVLSQPFAVLVFTQEFEQDWLDELKQLAQAANAKNTMIYLCSSSLNKAAALVSTQENIQLFSVDFTVVRTVARTSPTILFLKNGTIVKKYNKKQVLKAAEDLMSSSF